MQLPESLLRAIRGPALVAALAGCSGPPAAVELVPEPAPPPVAAPSDPVAYEPAAESVRLAAADLELGAGSARRERRIAFNVARAAARPPVTPPTRYPPRCGRG